ncbi:LysM peptidoglycan-binding domain-containing protein [Cryobacterium shii]|uniref:LysM peptidoglycan-binding domain-containing protein n=1 Tax=Cryobacterium shii TaxID=1259235 RepID=A0AAQ2C8W8_9MICO|nr:LysM peptidoglycan-binding domain-containing protein [Cryobacterium shii]TFC52060.1 LysM peptidoglycan-binding domain-containing protein [Cryobacterium shii]
MSAKASRISTNAPPSPAEGRHRQASSGTRRGLGILATVPLVLISTIAISLNLASPADAATLAKKPVKSRSNLPSPPADLARQAPGTSGVAAPGQYQVVEGDTVSGVAGRFGLSTASVLALNGLGWSASIFPGQTLILGQAKPAASAPAPADIAKYSIRDGDTISSVAAAHGLSTGAVLSANGLDGNSTIFPGQAIVLPGPGEAAPATVAAPPPSATAATAPGSHTIAAGDTIGAIAAAAGVSVQAVLDANGLGWSSIIYPGQVLAVPFSSSPSVSASASALPLEAVAPSAPTLPEPTAIFGVVTPLTDDMRRNAETIILVGRQAGVSDSGLVVALAAAAQESGLRNVAYGDRDSLGLFQQRPSSGWGTTEQVLDPVRASLAFFGGDGNPNAGVTRGLLDIAGWESMTVTQAAQAVQISAYPDHYAKWETSARAWLAELG